MYPKFTTPKTLTAQEQGRLLRVLRAHASPRDRALISLALGTGLRLRELVGLNVGDVSQDGRTVQWRVPLDPKITKGERGGTAFLVAGVREELRRYLRAKGRAKEPLEGRSPLFLSNQRRRICLRQVQVLFRKWQTAARFETLYPFHSLRHSAITNVYRATKDLYLTQRFARHASPLSTTVYTHPTDEELYEGIRRIKT
jgi:site-specific recombinase XerC